MFLTSFKFQSPRSSTASGWIFLNRGCKLPVSFRIYLCQRPNPAILWWLWQSGAIVDRLIWNDKRIYWNHLKHLNASKKLEARKHRKQNQMIRFWFLAIWFRSFPIPPATGDCNTYSISSLGNHLQICFARSSKAGTKMAVDELCKRATAAKALQAMTGCLRASQAIFFETIPYSLHCWLLLNYIGDGLITLNQS